MEKIKIFLKKNMKISIMIFMIMIFSLIFNNRVNAEELSQFCEYTEPCLSTERIDSWLDLYDTETINYDSFLIINYQTTSAGKIRNNFFVAIYQNTDLNNSNIYASFDSSSYYINFKNGVSRYQYSGNQYATTKISFANRTLSLFNTENNIKIGHNKDSKIEVVAYISNRDIKDIDGNIILPKNDIEEPKEDLNIINNRLFLTKLTNFYKSLFSIISNIASTILSTPILLLPFGFCILAIVVGVFYKLFLRR